MERELERTSIVVVSREVPVVGASSASFPVAKPRGYRFARVLKRSSFPYMLAALPTLFAALYLFAMAAPRYEVEARFVIRSAGQDPGLAMLSGALGSAMQSRAADEAFIIKDFLRSRDAVAVLAERVPLVGWLDPGALDLLFRYPPLLFAANDEMFFQHYLRFVDAFVDTSTGISTLRVRAFDPSQAVTISAALLDAAEKLLNRLNQRAQASALETARIEVELSRRRAQATLDALSEWRTREVMIDPVRVATTFSESITRLTLELVQTMANRAEAQRSAPRSPQISALTARIDALRQQIDQERASMAGANSELVRQVAEFERLVLNREFAERAYQSTLSSLEAARRESQQQQLFLERLVNPVAPDWPAYPTRWLWLLGVFGFSLAVAFVIRALVSDTLSHVADSESQ